MKKLHLLTNKFIVRRTARQAVHLTSSTERARLGVGRAYVRWLLKMPGGRRALTRAQQQYAAAQPARQRASRLHHAYRRHR